MQVTGNFDGWTRTNTPLVKENGKYKGSIRVRNRQKVVLKFVINGSDWRVSEDYKTEHDSEGIENNYIDADELIEMQEFEQDAAASMDETPNSYQEDYIPDVDRSIHDNVEADSEDAGSDGDANSRTNSISNSTVLSTPSGTQNRNQELETADTSMSNYNSSARYELISRKQPSNQLDDNSSNQKYDMVEILRAPGAYPLFPPDASGSNMIQDCAEDNRPTAKRDTLISRFKNLFKY